MDVSSTAQKRVEEMLAQMPDAERDRYLRCMTDIVHFSLGLEACERLVGHMDAANEHRSAKDAAQSWTSHPETDFFRATGQALGAPLRVIRGIFDAFLD